MMPHPRGYFLAQLNIGRLVAPTDDPRVAEFMAALDRVNGLGKRMPGFVWMMEGSGEPGTGNVICGADGCLETTPDGVPMQFDYGHLTLEGSKLVIDRIRDQLRPHG